MKEPRGSIYFRFALMAGCVVVGAVVHVIYQRYVTNVVVSAVVINISALVLLYAFMNAHYSWRRKNLINKAKEALEEIKQGRKPPEADQTSEHAPIFNAICDLDRFIDERERTRSEILSLLNSVASNMEIESMLNALLPKVIATSGSNWGAFYINNETTGKLEIKASLGFSKTIYSEFDINIGESGIGMAARTKEIQLSRDLADDNMFVTRTFLGKVRPTEVMSVPILKGDNLVGVLALATTSEGYTPSERMMVTMIQEYIGAAVANSVAFEQHKRIMGELRFQNNLIRDLYDELQSKAVNAVSEADVSLRAVCETLSEAFDPEPAYALLDPHGCAIYASRECAIMLAGAVTDLSGADIFGIFAEREKISAFTSAGQGTERFRLAVGGVVSVYSYVVKNSDGMPKYLILKLTR